MRVHHQACGFTDWWLRDPPLRPPLAPAEPTRAALRAYLALDPALERNFFRLPDRTLRRIALALERKAEATLRSLPG